MSCISSSDYISLAACSGTLEEADLLSAHLGIYDHHVATFTAHMEELDYLEWEHESSIYDKDGYDEVLMGDEDFYIPF